MTRHSCSAPWVLIATLLAAACRPATVELTPEHAAFPVVATARVPRGELRGAVVDAPSSSGIRRARVVVRWNALLGEQDSAVDSTNVNGHFVLAVPPATPVEISVGAIGWTPLAGVPLTLAGPTGHVALIALQRRPVPPSPPHPPPPSNASFTTVRPSPDARVAGGALEGNVLDDSAGRPLPGARVTVARAALTWRLDSMNASRFELVETPVAAAVTDRTGRFHFSGLDADRVVIAVQLLGYGPATVAYAPARGIGYSTTIALPHHTPLICSDSPTSYPWVHVRVLDLVTGTAPDTATLVVLRDGHRASSSTPEGARSRVLQLGAGSFSGNQFAPSEVIVRSPGFSTWRAHDVRAQLEPCGGLGSVILTAWLLPQATEPR